LAEPIRILHVFGKLNIGGAESRIMDLYRNIDKDRVQFDFVIHTAEECFFSDEIRKMGGRIYSVPRFKIYNYFSYSKAWKKLMANIGSDYEMIQGHMTSTASIYLPIAKKNGVKSTIAHARSAGVDAGFKGKLTNFLRRNLADRADFLFTCSRIAGISVFGQKAVDEKRTVFIPNAIDIKKFEYDAEVRYEIRKELGIENRTVIGHVGRFHYAKNHEFLLKIFREVMDRFNKDSEGINEKPVLLLLGEGPRMEEMKNLSRELGIEKDVIFAGNHADVYRYYQGMDYFLYPSRYEGLPGTVVEAQASGLKTLMSSSICDEVIFSDLVNTKSISDSEVSWAEEILKDLAHSDIDEKKRKDYNETAMNSGFDVKKQAEKMMRFYETGKLDDNC